MKCLKCGSAISSSQVFCGDCLADMERHPVKPGTPIMLPNRPARPVGRSNRRRVKKPEERIANLRSLVFWLILLIIALGTALTVTVLMLLNAADAQAALPGILF